MSELKKISNIPNRNNVSNNIYLQTAQEVKLVYDNEKRKEELGAEEIAATKSVIETNRINRQYTQKKRADYKIVQNDIQNRINNDQFVTESELRTRDHAGNVMDISDITSEIEAQQQLHQRYVQNSAIKKKIVSGYNTKKSMDYVNVVAKTGADIQAKADMDARKGEDIGFDIRRRG